MTALTAPARLLLLVLVAACTRKAPPFQLQAIDGGDGLLLQIPRDHRAKRLGDTLQVVSPRSDKSRSPLQVLISTTVIKPELPGQRSRELQGRTIHYTVEHEEGGSGGEGLRLRAWVESGGRYVVLDSLTQPESGGDGDFQVEWAILPTLRWHPPR